MFNNNCQQVTLNTESLNCIMYADDVILISETADGLQICLSKKSLKIPKGLSESVNRRTDNTLVKRKITKGRTTIYKLLHRKLKIEQHEPHSQTGVTRVLLRDSQLLLH